MEQMIEIRLHGRLKKLVPETIKVSASCVAEAINGFGKIADVLKPHPGKDRELVQIVGYQTKESLYQTFDKAIGHIDIIPAMVGGKKGGFFQVVLGAVLVAAAFAFPPAAAGSASLFGLGATGSFIFNIGISMVLGGILSFLSPQPKIDRFGNGAADPEASKYLGASQNTTRIGTRIPIVYGRMLCYGHYLSFNVDSVDVAL